MLWMDGMLPQWKELEGTFFILINYLPDLSLSSVGGFHPIQLSLVDHNGSQCGFCTPGFVMSMYRWVLISL